MSLSNIADAMTAMSDIGTHGTGVAASSPAVIAQQATPDSGVRSIAQFSARCGYALMCLTLSWGVFTRTGWVARFGDRKTLRSGHMVLGTLTLVFGVVHAMCFLFLTTGAFGLAEITIPLLPGGLVRHALGIVGLEVMLAVALTSGIYRWTAYRRWVWLHRLSYPAVGLTAVHSWFGAMANGNLAILWVGGLSLLVPALTLTVLRFAPSRVLTRVGLAEEDV